MSGDLAVGQQITALRAAHLNGAACPLRDRCTHSDHGRSVTIHPDERRLAELRERQQTALGRAKVRERVQGVVLL